MSKNTRNPGDVVAAVAIAILLILTAWGNAIAMAVVSATAFLALIVWIGWQGLVPLRRGILVATVSAAVALIFAQLLLWR